MRNPFGGKTRKKIALAAAVAVVAAGGAVAFAYFTSTGTGTGNGTVGTATAWTVTVGSPTGGALLPGSGTDTFAVSVKNAGAGNQLLTSISVAVNTSGPDAATALGADIPGCLASWFTASVALQPTTPDAVPYDVPGGVTEAGGSVTLVLNDAAANQNACESALPGITVTAS